MKVVVLSPRKLIAAGVIAALLIAASGAGVAAMTGVLGSEPAQAYKWPIDGGQGVGSNYWYFAEGYTGPGFEEWILIFNPPSGPGGSGIPVSPTIRMYGPAGEIGRYDVPTLNPGQRRSININEACAYYGYSGDVSIVVEGPAVGGRPFICERAMYWDYKGKWQGGSTILGYEEAETGR
jgi:hypothetical protein